MAKPNKDTLLDWYYQMTLIREFEETCQSLYEEKRITGVYLHLYSGQEAVAVGALAALNVGDDHVITAYRDHGIALAMGMDPNKAMAEMMGRRAGVSGGKGGSMHLADKDLKFWGGYAIVGGHIPLGVGLAFEASYRDSGAVTLCFVGDGATNNGYFHEAVNMAAVWDLPIVFLIESNGYGMGTETERASGQEDLHKRAIAYGIKDGGRIYGQNVLEVYQELGAAYEYARENGPVLLEAETYRYRGHGVSDSQYKERDKLADELARWKDERDPLTIWRNQLKDEYKTIDDSTLDKLDEEAKEVVAEAVEFAEDSPLPDTYDELTANVYIEE